MIPARVVRRLSDDTFFGFIVGVLALCSSTAAVAQTGRSNSAPAYRFVVDYFNFRPDGTFLSKQRVAGGYRHNNNGTVEWSNVNIATASALDATFGLGQPQAYMNGFRYRPSGDWLFKPEFFKDFPATASQAKNLVWDTFMFETLPNLFFAVFALLLFPAHEFGHYLTYRLLGMHLQMTLNTASPKDHSLRRPVAELAGPLVNLVVATGAASAYRFLR